MPRLAALALLAAPLIAAVPIGSAVIAQTSGPLVRLKSHLRAVGTMTANFVQTDQQGRGIGGSLTLKRPGKIRFEYAKNYPVLVVGDGRALTMIDYEVKQVSRWPISSHPLAVLLNPDMDLTRIATVVQDDNQVLGVRVRDPKKPEFGTITVAFTKDASAPAGLMLHGWTIVDAQNNRTVVKLTGQRFNVAVADSRFRWVDPRPKGPRG